MGEPGRSIAELGLTADLRAEPWHYPGPFLPFSCVQEGDRLLPLPRGSVTEAEFARRHCVIATGSNASPDVIRRKFERRGVSTTIFHLRARLEGIALGYSAHVSLAGYIPATAYADTVNTLNVVVSALTDEQLQCLDETERNYNRVTIAASGLRDSGHELPERAHLYLSKWGLIVDGAERPVPFGTQSTIFDRLADWGVLPGGANLREILSRHAKRYPEPSVR